MSEDVDVRQLRAFLAVAEEGTIGGAARRLGLAQSTVSECLSALDRALGTLSIQRKPGAQRATLTDAQFRGRRNVCGPNRGSLQARLADNDPTSARTRTCGSAAAGASRPRAPLSD
jgi:molybdenum-dependent DNA-binding transcriptional regulator ModE